MMYKPNSVWTWSFMAVTFVQAAIILGLEAYIFVVFEKALVPASYRLDEGKTATKSIPTFLTLYIFGLIYQLVLVWDALRMKNTIQIIGLCIYNFGIMIYSSIQVDQMHQAIIQLGSDVADLQIWEEVRPCLIAIPCVLALGTVLMSGVASKLYDEFAWTIYKHISADLKMKRRYLTFQIYIALLKFDFFFFLGFTIQFVVNVVNTTDPEFGLTIAAIPITILILLMAAHFTRKENKIGMSAIIFLYFAALAYFIFKLVRMYNGPKANDYIAVKKVITAFAVITLILIIVTIVNAIACTMNFDQGLKPHVISRKKESEEEKNYMTEMPDLSHAPVPSRMTIE